MQSRGRWLAASLILLGLGWLLSGYLLYRVFQFSGQPAADVCSAVFGKSCDETLQDPRSWQLGVPLASWGLMYFAAIGLLLSWGGERSLAWAQRLAAIGVGASIVLIGVIITGQAHACGFCLLIHGLNFALAFSLNQLRPAAPTPPPPEDAPPVQASSSRRRYASLLCCVVLGVIAQGSISLHAARAARIGREAIIEGFRVAPQVDLDVDPNADHILGDPEARVQLIVFNSFQCPSCQVAANATRHLKDHFGDQVCIVFKHFPLSSKCNPVVPSEFQVRACDASWAAEAAGQQGRFWEYHDALYGSDLRYHEETLVALAEQLGMDLERWQADRTSEQVLANVSADIDQGRALGINATPTIFLNRRRVPSTNVAALGLLIKRELEP